MQTPKKVKPLTLVGVSCAAIASCLAVGSTSTLSDTAATAMYYNGKSWKLAVA